jgi:hypothetical protein
MGHQNAHFDLPARLPTRSTEFSCAAAHQRAKALLVRSRFSLGVLHLFEIGNQPGARRAPSQPFLRLRA